jgi:phosphate transport system substrate-binding protein
MKTLYKNSTLLLAFLFLISCNRDETILDNISTDDELGSKQISISCDDQLQKIMVSWVEDFNQSHPKIQISVQDSNADFLLISENRVIELNDTDAWRVPVMREGIIPVISENNPYLNILEQQGISKENLKKIFTGEQISWGEVLGNDAGEKVIVFLPEIGRSCNTKWADFLEIDTELLQGKRFSNKEILLNSMKQDPYIIAVLNDCCAFNPETNEKEAGIIALSMDLNNDGRIDNKEEITDDLCDLERALYLGLRPSQLCNCIFLQAEQFPKNIEQIVFIKWILTEGQKHVVDNGYSIIRNSMAVKAIQNLEAQVN